MENKDIIEFLYKEKETARQEIFLNVKAVNQVSLVLLPFFFAAVGLLLGYGDVKFNINNIDDAKFLLLLKIIEQIMFLLWMYGLSIVSNMASLAGYIHALEEKINHFAKEELTVWESIIQVKQVLNYKSGQLLSTVCWNFMYFLLFVWIAVYICIKNNVGFPAYSIINCLEIFAVLYILFLARSARMKSYNLSKLNTHITKNHN